MAYPVTLNGRTYTLADFEGNNYVDGLPDAFEDFITHAGDIYNDTSTTSNSIGTGSKTFTVSSGKPYQAGTPLRIADAAAPATNFLDAVVTSYSGTTLVVEAIGYGGSGTLTSWTVNIGGAKTIDGTLGVSQGGTGATTAAAARTNLETYSKTEADSRFLNVSGEASDVTMTGNVTIGDAAGDTLTVNATADFNTGFNVDGTVTSDGLIVQATGANYPLIEHSSGNRIQLQPSYNYYNSFQHTFKNLDGSLDTLTIGQTGDITFYNSSGNASFVYDESAGSTFNEQGAYRDFRVESVGKTHMFFVDGLTNRVGINESAPSYTLDVGEATAGNLVAARLHNKDATSGSGVSLLFSNSAFGGSNDGEIRYTNNAQNNNNNFQFYGEIAGVNGLVQLGEFEGGGGRWVTQRGAVINESGINSDFRVESDSNSYMLAVDASANRVGINTNAPGNIFHIYNNANYDTGLRIQGINHYWDFNAGESGYSTSAFNINYNGTKNVRMMQNNFTAFYTSVIVNEDGADKDFRVESDSNANMLFVDAGANTVQIAHSSALSIAPLNIQASTGARAIRIIGRSDDYGEFDFYENDNTTILSRIQAHTSAFNIRTYDPPMVLQVSGTTDAMRLTSTDVVVNESGANRDFRVESDSNTHIFFVDAGNNRLGINTSTPQADFDIVRNSSTGFSNTSDQRAQSALTIRNGSEASGRYVGMNLIAGGGAQSDWSINNVWQSNYVGKLAFKTRAGANSTDWRQLFAMTANNEAVFNEDSTDFDFRVESDSNAHMMFVSAGNNVVCFGTSRETALAVQNSDVGVQINQYGRIFMATDDHSDFNKFNTGELFRFRRNAVQVGNIAVSSSSTTYNTTSDYRLKENVVDLTGATERLKQLSPKRFNFIIEPDETVDGFIAHEVSDIVPQAVTGEKDAVDENGEIEPQNIDHSKLVPLLVATIKELEARITALENA